MIFERTATLLTLMAMSIFAGCSDGRIHRADLAEVTPDASIGVLSGRRFAPQPGWNSREPASRMRAAEFDLESAAADGNHASLVVYYFGIGAAGSVDANIERWCGQFEQPDGSDPSDVARIEARTINGFDVHTIDLGGTYVAETRPGSGERLNKPDYHMLAAIVQSEAGPYYFKLVGPVTTVERWRGSYDMMLNSLQPAPAGASGAAHP